jgi:hypothetical protein
MIRETSPTSTPTWGNRNDNMKPIAKIHTSKLERTKRIPEPPSNAVHVRGGGTKFHVAFSTSVCANAKIGVA